MAPHRHGGDARESGKAMALEAAGNESIVAVSARHRGDALAVRK